MRTRVARSQFEGLLQSIYHAALDESVWPEFLHGFADALGGCNTALLVGNSDVAQNNAAVSVRTDPEQLRLYNEHYCAINPWFLNAPENLPAGFVGVGEMHYSVQDLVRTEFYDGWLRPQKLKHSIAAVVVSSETQIVMCSSLRTAKAGPFSPREIDFCRELLPHFRRALRVRERIGHTFDYGRQALDVLENATQACVFVNRDTRPVFVNRAARGALAGNGPLRLAATGLVASRPVDTAALQCLVASAARANGTGGEMKIPREFGRPILILVSPIQSGLVLPLPTDIVAAIWITDLEYASISSTHRMRTLFGLTHAEESIAGDIAHGVRLSEIADRRRISRHTVRNQLKSIFAKTGARSQSDLVRLVFSCLNPGTEP